MLRRLLTCVFLLNLTALCLPDQNAAQAQVTDSTHPQAADTTRPISIDPELNALATTKTPKEYTLAGIKITGTKFLDETLLVSISGLTVGDKVIIPGGDNFSKAITNLWKQNLFSDITIYYTRIVGNSIYIEINVTERPRLSNFYFKGPGVKKGDADDLGPKSGLIKGRVVTENMKRTAEQAIKKFYADKGYQDCQVRITETRDPSVANSDILTFNIEKGNKVRVSQINFYGNKAIAESKLKHQMKDTKELSRLTLYPPENKSTFGPHNPVTFKEYINNWGFLSFTGTKEFLDPYFRFKLFSSAKFNQSKYETDKQKILEYLNSQGYRDAAIDSDQTQIDKKGRMTVNIKVAEGHKYYFGNIAWKGNTKYSDSILTLIMGIHKGDVYNLDILNKKLGKQMSPEGGDISGLYMDDGYLFFHVDPVETAVYNDTIDFEIRMTEGPQATIKNVTISGNERTKEYVIRRELRTIPGDKFSRTDLIRSQREIANLGFFNQEKINPQVNPNQEDGTVDINWQVEEKSADQLELSAGWGGGIGLTGTVGVTFNNFSIHNIFSKSAWDPLPTGDGQKLSLRIQSNGKAYQSYNFSFTEPWLGGKKRNSLTVSLYRSVFRTGGYNYRTNTYQFSDSNSLKNFGATIALGKQLKWPDDFFTLTYSVNYTQYDLNNYPLFTAAFRNGHSTNFSFKIALSRYDLDQPIFPRRGSSQLLSVQFTPPYSSFDKNLTQADSYKLPEYHKWRLTSDWYLPIGNAMGADKSRQFVLKASAKYGFMGRYNSALGYSPFERFQLGDAGLTNNFGLLGYDIISQRGYPVYENSDPKVNPDQQTASQFFTIFNKYTLELRYPFTTNPSSTIYGLTFFEAANGWYNYQDYNPFRLRRSVGVGMRFFLPMFGLLGFDYGVGLDRIQNGSLKDATRFTFMLGYEPE
ncbi:MAG: POTRA domain-containing protein [Bacteroidota bacterium]|nr:POTRA domain-containing protein [Bacteroidota bacterium]MDP4216992.1 POTRA domain-containing protein [Bacteroidota bacterium]MDP4245204.1 POTRA domain-containing protein [Bacteroidota bacterium]MDP4253223.1 POTRA domain-containing protein [Bacteroidota bacterium]MDP4258261.1 POTRA domain-containing protein [Bacteroidota bacterium]